MVLKFRHPQINFTRHLTKRFVLIVVAAILFNPLFEHLNAQSAQWEWEGIDRVIAIGDVHGSHEKLVTLLCGMELIDD